MNTNVSMQINSATGFNTEGFTPNAMKNSPTQAWKKQLSFYMWKTLQMWPGCFQVWPREQVQGCWQVLCMLWQIPLTDTHTRGRSTVARWAQETPCQEVSSLPYSVPLKTFNAPVWLCSARDVHQPSTTSQLVRNSLACLKYGGGEGKPNKPHLQALQVIVTHTQVWESAVFPQRPWSVLLQNHLFKDH